MATNHDASRNSYIEQLSDNERRLLNSGWPIVALFGQSGTGKSTFINLIAQEKQEVGDSIESCTERVTFVEARINGQPVVVVDTPGIDDTRPGVTEADVLTTIARCLEVTGRQKQWVTGVLYLHRITDTRFTPTASRVSIMLKKLCGETAMNRVMFCTTMWDMPSSNECTQRHEQLCRTSVLAGMIKSGTRTATHSNRWADAGTNAQKILSDLTKGSIAGPLVIQDQMIEQDKTVAETDAGQVLMTHLREERARTERELRDLRQQMSAESGANAAKLAEALAAQESLKTELERQQHLLTREARCPSCIIC